MPALHTILVADDNLVCQRVTCHMLDRLGYASVVCGTGLEAIDLCLSETFACVLMDGIMPDMDGFEAAREIRRRERGRKTPILALTGSGSPSDREYSFASGMNGFLTKPVQLEHLAEALARWIPELPKLKR